MKNYIPIIIGLLFTAIGFWEILVFVVSFFIMLPAAHLESVFQNIFGSKSFEPVGQSMIITLAILFMLTTFWYYKSLIGYIKKANKINIIAFITYLILQLFIIHPLGFYLHLSTDWDMAHDGQVIFAVIETFPKSSLVFFFLGLLTTVITESKIKTLDN